MTNKDKNFKKVKESSARRKERLQFSKRLTTKIVESKKTQYNRNKIKTEMRRDEND